MSGSSSNHFISFPSLTAIENVMLPLELGGRRDARQAAAAALAQVGLTPRMAHYPKQLSGGEQQRVAIARAFVTHPKVLFADEPTGNLDTATGQRITDLLFDLNRSIGSTLVLVTHDRNLARCSRVWNSMPATPSTPSGGRPSGGPTAAAADALMQALRFALRNLWRDLKSGELSVLLLALLVAVLSLTAVGFFTSRISQGVRAASGGSAGGGSAPGVASRRSRSTISTRPLRADFSSARVLSFPTAIFSGDSSQLAALNAVTASYPLRGHMRIADAPFGSPRITDQIPGRGEVWIDARIIAQLKLELGATLRIGAGSFRVTEVLDYRPDQGTGFVNLAPAALLNYDDIAVHAADPAGQPGHLCGAVRGHARRRWRRSANT